MQVVAGVVYAFTLELVDTDRPEMTLDSCVAVSGQYVACMAPDIMKPLLVFFQPAPPRAAG
jgi:hypothetical protein